MRGIVRPVTTSTQAGAAPCIEIVPVNEAVVDEQAVIAPAEPPSVSAPTTPASSEVKPHRDSQAESEVSASDERRITPICIRIVKGRAPDIGRIVIRQVHHRRIGRLDSNDRLPGVVHIGHPLLRGAG